MGDLNLGAIVALVIGGLATAVAWLARLLKNAKEREHAAREEVKQLDAMRAREKAAQDAATRERRKTNEAAQQAAEDVKRGSKDQFSSPR